MRIGIEIDANGPLATALEVVFQGGVISSAEQILQAEAQRCAERIYVLVALRGAVATSGAMRWPWSQEFAIDTITLQGR